MQTIYSVKLKFPTVAPLFCVRTFFVPTAQAVETIKSNCSAWGCEFLGFSVQHVMVPGEVLADVAREVTEQKRAAGEA